MARFCLMLGSQVTHDFLTPSLTPFPWLVRIVTFVCATHCCNVLGWQSSIVQWGTADLAQDRMTAMIAHNE